MLKLRALTLALAACLLFVATLPAQTDDEKAKALAEYIAASYTKYEYRIPMRDGKKLFTAVYVPKDDSRKYGMMLLRTPYGINPYGVDQYRDKLGPSELFAREGLIFVYQDVRGRYLSEGTFVEATPHRPAKKGPTDVDESSDTHDTIEWLLHQVPGNNGKVGMWGISYPGFYAAAGMIDAHPALVAVSPQAPVTDLFQGDDSFHNGAFMLAANYGFYAFFDKHDDARLPDEKVDFDFKTKDGYEYYLALGPLANSEQSASHGKNPYWKGLMEHTTYDSFWQERSLWRHLRNVAPAVLTVGGFFDAEDPMGPLLVYRAIEKNAPKTDNHLVLGPWPHGGWSRSTGDHLGNVSFRSKTSEYFRSEIEFPFFRNQLSSAEKKALPKASIFETGTNRWRGFDSWPPKEAKSRKLYLRENGKLSFEAPTASEGSDSYTSDPAKPVPFTEEITTRVPRTYMVSDQRFAAKRPDVLVYQSEILEEDLTIAGPIKPNLWITSTGTDADFVVKLIDVYPNDFPNPDPNPNDLQMGGYQQLLRGEPFRAKFRSSLEKPEPLEPGKLTKIEFSMPDLCHVFRRGHRIMVQVQSSWFPLVDRNPQTFVDIPNAKPEEFVKATQTLRHSAKAASFVDLGVLEASTP